MKFKAKLVDLEQGQNEVVFNEAQAQELDLNLMDRVDLVYKTKNVTSMIDHSKTFVAKGEVGLFLEVSSLLGAKDGDLIEVNPVKRPNSLDYIRKKLDGGVLQKQEINSIIVDLMAQKLSSAELAAFIAAVYIKGLSTDETAFLTESIIASGETLPSFGGKPTVSEHSIGGVAGGRTSMIILPIMTSLGMIMPKTASRAISSACATADTMEVLAPVTLSINKLKQVVQKTGGCLVWGGAVNMAAADDKLIRIRRPLHLDPQPLLVASILAKKKAEGAQYVILDIPIGRGVKVQTLDEGRDLARHFEAFSMHLGIKLTGSISDGSNPLLSGVGPNLEAREVLELLSSKGKKDAMILEKACLTSGVLLHMVRGISKEEGYRLARYQLESGRAEEKFREILEAQGGNPDVKPSDLSVGKESFVVKAVAGGSVSHIDNKAISRIARALGSPQDAQAGILFKVKKGDEVKKGQELFTLYATDKERLERGIEQVKFGNPLETRQIIFELV